ncbi:poly-gamma-glutamate biosynthesis protein PgsC/CapC [bacterium]|nr:poly-gamma-glutamate biosynthesis protein PgsC/CapC [candidate division CSSED10-310 bacterium]
MQLAVFPGNGLSNSVIPPVLVGLGLSTVFTETLGWNFSGLIVPGYLAPIFIVKPLSGVVIIIEAFISYVILRLLSDGFSRFGIWTRFFGQDAFFALFCISILVKCLLEGPFLPVMGDIFVQIFHNSVDYRNELHSTGLIVVPLMANIFWRHGIRRNIVPISTVILLTYLFTRFVLIPYTNFSVNQFELMYSKMALNFEASPIFYFILIIGAFMASHNKYRFGWSYHGMLIPALLGIAWLTPLKILTTFTEAGLILLIGWYLVRRRFMQNMTVEGPRKLLFLFGIGFALKMGLGFTLADMYPGFQASDLYGFAYILPALLAMEMWPGRYYLKVARVTVQTSFLAAVLGMATCLAFQVFLPHTFIQQSDQPVSELSIQPADAVVRTEGGLGLWIADTVKPELTWGADHRPIKVSRLSQFDRHVLTPVVRALGRSGELPVTSKMEQVLHQSGYSIIDMENGMTRDRYWIFTETDRSGGYHGTYIFRQGRASPRVIQVPNPLSETNTLEVGLELFHDLNARALFISGTSRRKLVAEFDVTHLESRISMFQLMHQVIHREMVETDPVLSIQIRGVADLTIPGIDAVISSGEEIRDPADQKPELVELKSQLVSLGMTVRDFSGIPDDMQYSSRSIAQHAYVRDFNMGVFAVLWISPEFRKNYESPELKPEMTAALGWVSGEGDLRERIMRAELAADSAPTGLLTIRDAIGRELAGYARSGHIGHLWNIASLADGQGYAIEVFLDSSRNVPFLCLQHPEPDRPLFVFNFNMHSPEPITIEIPSDSSETRLNEFVFSRSVSLTAIGVSS